MEECYWVLVKDVADGNPQNCGTVIVLVKGNRADCLHIVSPYPTVSKKAEGFWRGKLIYQLCMKCQPL